MLRTRVVLCSLALVAAACGGKEQPGGPDSTLQGYGLSPFGFPDRFDELGGFLAEVGRLPNPAVLWNGSWRDDAQGGSDAGTVPEGAAFVQTAAAQQGFTPLPVFGWRSGDALFLKTPADSTNTWANLDARARYRDMLVSFVEESQPPYVFLGNENEFYWAQDPEDYLLWIEAYEAAYDAIKAVSPSTRVGPVFNFENLAGSGALNGWTEAKWEALTAHDLGRVDVVGVTVYPWLNHQTPHEVPATYLQPLFDRIGDLPVAITETGWPAGDPGGLGPLWTTSPEAQKAYAERLPALTAERPVELVVWLFLHQMAPADTLGWKLFATVSLFDETGSARPAYETWLGLGPRL